MKNQTPKITKIQLVKKWLLQGWTITARQCSIKFGADRLADIIFKLRHKHHMNIEGPLTAGKDRYGNDVEYAVYKWLGEVPHIRFAKTQKRKGVIFKSYIVWHRFPISDQQLLKHIRSYLKKKKVRITASKTVKNPRQFIFTAKTNKIYGFLIYEIE